jgi:DNA (cytosine-5)-methyltransferase 1
MIGGVREKNPPLQAALFHSAFPVESFSIDRESGSITRVVERRGQRKSPVVSEVGIWDRAYPLDDLRAAADRAYLQRSQVPTWVGSRAKGSVRVVDLFSGCGAMSLGVAEASRALGMSFQSAGAFDWNRRALEVYAANFRTKQTEPVDLAGILQADLRPRASQAERSLLKTVGSVDFVLAGPPCQGHSNLNNRTRRHDPKNELYFLVARFAKLTKPRWILIENVLAVIHDRGRVVDRTIDALQDLGYRTVTGVVDLWTLGVAQTRRRHVLVAELKEGSQDRLSSRTLEDMLSPYVTRTRSVRWAIEDLMNVSSGSFDDQPKTPDPVTQSRIDYLFDNGLYDLPDTLRPDCHREKDHSYKSVYGRMKWEEPAPTITSGYDTMGRGRFVHPKRRRTITAHEAARIQFIPDFFDFAPASDHRSGLSELIGNAVPPKLSYVLALELLR